LHVEGPRGIDYGQEGVAQGDELRRCGAPAGLADRVLRERGDEERLLQQREVVGDRLERAPVLELTLDLLQRQDLRGRRGRQGEDLSQERGPP
jgi:hypothetical protein